MRNIFVLGITCALSFSLAADTLSAASYAQDGLVGQWDGIETRHDAHRPLTTHRMESSSQSVSASSSSSFAGPRRAVSAATRAGSFA